jgi:hypothetical protein
MKCQRSIFLPLIFVLLIPFSAGAQQPWSGILDPTRAIDWTNVGVPGGIPNRTTICASLTPSSSLAQINAALSACPSGGVVSLSAGTYNINGTINVPSNVSLRGAGTLATILNATGTGGAVIQMGSTGPSASSSVNITSGNTAGSTIIGVASTANIHVGGYIMVTEINDPTYVTITTPNGICTWCDGSMFGGTRVRGQIVEVESVSGNSVTISPALYSNYGVAPGTGPALATPFAASAKSAGVESLQVFANNTGYAQTFSMNACAYCWIKGVFDNYTDGDHVDVTAGYRDEIRDSYFSNAYLHTAGSADSDISLLVKTSGTLVENNILERLHVGILVDWGAAGNVIAYNYSYANFDVTAALVILSSFGMHGAHPQFNLFEGNVANSINWDSFWGSGSNNTNFRNQYRATDTIAPPFSGRGPINWAAGVLANEQTRGIVVAFPHTNSNSVGNVLGSADAKTVSTAGLYNSGLAPFTSSVVPPANRVYNNVFYALSFGYDTGSDSSGGDVASFDGGFWVGKASSSAFNHGNFDIASNAVIWAQGVTQALPPSFFLSSRPAWWGGVPFPAIGPDVTGGAVDSAVLAGHVNAIPAEVCYDNTSRDSNGIKSFDPSVCYGGTSQTGPPPAPPTNLGVLVN